MHPTLGCIPTLPSRSLCVSVFSVSLWLTYVISEGASPADPGPVPVGSPIQAGGVSQTNARIAITHRS